MAKEANPILCCTGSFPGSYTLVTFLFALTLEMVAAVPVASLRLMRLLQFVSLCTAPLGIWALRKEQRVKNVPRGCDCCCTCPYPAWSLLLQLLDILLGLLSTAFAMEGFDTATIIFNLVNFVCVILDVVFSVLWLRALLDQDGDVCCGESKAGAKTPALVVGRPVMTQDENVVTGVPAEEDLKAQSE
eukprot:TRINITY_DN20192_c0_g1_i4.p1 TRINITY_DN20192_c0_g1~~TRINITY_DN20192_c0_g1_i4.p1  ORF type:complete len:188 (+),score=21.50 TRINITY_DN20192_c0_g1_i4:110-673(+)